MIPAATCIHYIDGRARLKIAERRHDREYFARLRHRISEIPGVRDVSVTPLTGSILLFLGETGLKEIAAVCEAEGLFALRGKVGRNFPLLADATEGVYRKVDGRIRSLTGGDLDLPAVVFASLIGSALWQLAKGKTAGPPWSAGLWYATSIFLKAHPGEGKGRRLLMRS